MHVGVITELLERIGLSLELISVSRKQTFDRKITFINLESLNQLVQSCQLFMCIGNLHQVYRGHDVPDAC